MIMPREQKQMELSAMSLDISVPGELESTVSGMLTGKSGWLASSSELQSAGRKSDGSTGWFVLDGVRDL